MLNQGYVGHSLPATDPVEITVDAVAAFCEALGQSGGQGVPATFLISVTLPAADALINDPEFGLDFSRVLHREQKFTYRRPLKIGDVVTCTVTVESIKVVAGNELLTLRNEVHDADGSAVASVTTTLFVAAEPAEDTA
ncbi:MAG TPA: MaoC family dehydratase N-terminal domain-containing protein [Candidatus Stackebrandtia excrementipullorum]|nr:MaoC family dehydratase N-terminal domain-containing protein [Candidatus Stackebrandtia excrementipullorum]